MKCFRLNSGRSVSITVNKTRKHFSRNIHGARIFPNVSLFPTQEILFPVSVFSRCKLCLRYTTGNFNENPNMRALAKLLRARASEPTSNFCEQFEQRPNFASTSKLDGIDHSKPLYYVESFTEQRHDRVQTESNRG